MVRIKTNTEIEIMAQGGHILSWVVDQVVSRVKPGVSTQELTELAEKLIQEKKAESSFKGYKAAWSETAFPSALCLSINNEVVHGLPIPSRQLKTGDIVGIDCGLKYQGLYTDMAVTVGVGRISNQAKELIAITRTALKEGIEQVKPGHHLSDIARAIEQTVTQAGYAVVTQLVGHGVGYAAHEEPQIPNYLGSNLPDVELKPGMCLALEPMVNLGKGGVSFSEDGWTVLTADNSLSAHFEHTVVVTTTGYRILTQ